MWVGGSTDCMNVPGGSQLSLFASDRSGALCFVDVQNMGQWRIGGTWGAERGPDPLDEFELFRNTVRAAASSSPSSSTTTSSSKTTLLQGKPICEVMLDQSLFNGIGNYLRAEVLFRAGVNPFDDAKDVLSGPKGEEIIGLCRCVAQEVLCLGLNKYGSPEEVKEFEKWLKIYGKGKSKKDNKKRVIWFSEQQLNNSNSNSNNGSSSFPSSSTTTSTATTTTTSSSSSTMRLENEMKSKSSLDETLEEVKRKSGVSENESGGWEAMLNDGTEMMRAVLIAYQVDGDFEEAVDSFRRLQKFSPIASPPPPSSSSSSSSLPSSTTPKRMIVGECDQIQEFVQHGLMTNVEMTKITTSH